MARQGDLNWSHKRFGDLQNDDSLRSIVDAERETAVLLTLHGRQVIVHA